MKAFKYEFALVMCLVWAKINFVVEIDNSAASIHVNTPVLLDAVCSNGNIAHIVQSAIHPILAISF